MPPKKSAASPRPAAPDRGSAEGTGERDARDTKTRILDAAEALFIEQGFTATSMRAIATRAGVNLAAAHYHFGSKEGLLGATYHRRVAPGNARRLEQLEALTAGGRTASVRELMHAFLEPFVGADPNSPMPRLVGRVFGEPDSVARPILEKAFTPVVAPFFAALRKTLPDQSPEVIRWRFYFVVGSMVHLLAFDRPPVPVETPVHAADALDQLVDFAVNGMDPDGKGMARD